MTRRTLGLLFAVLIFVIGAMAAPTATVTLTGTYDFTINNACSATVTAQCVKLFNIYDLTSGTPVKIGSIAAPSGANTATAVVSGSFTIPALVAGIRSFSVAATMADGTESDPKAPTATSSTTVSPGVPGLLKLTVVSN